CLSEADRAQNAMLLLPCDEQDIAWPPPIIISDIDWSAPAAERTYGLQTLAELSLPAAVLAVSAPRRIASETLSAWHVDAQQIFSAAGTRLIGFFSAWPMHVNQLTPTA